MKRLGLLFALFGVVALIARPSAMIPEQVRIDTGLLSGVAGTSQPTVRAFKGIPFAAAPLGENRWKAPQPAAKWDGVRKADAFGAPCAAGAPFGGRGGGRGAAPGAAAPAQAAPAGTGGSAPRAGARRGLSLRQRVDQRRVRQRQAAGDGVDLRRRLLRRVRRHGLV